MRDKENDELARQVQLRATFRDLFGINDAAPFAEIESDLTFVELAQGDVLIRQHESADCIYFVVSGRLRALASRGDKDERLGEIARGETIGEVGLITGEPRSATIVAVRHSLVARMTKEIFERVLTGRPQVSLAIMRTIIERFGQNTRTYRRRNRPVTLCMVPITDGVDELAIGHQLQTLLREYGGTVRLISSRDLGAFSIRDRNDAAESNSAVGAWIDSAEAGSSTLILVADQDTTEWSRCCIARSDEILLLARADAHPRISALEAACFGHDVESAPAQTLVLLHQESRRCPTGTGAWLDRRPVERHLHVRVPIERDMRRLARVVSGRGVGLVLSGGGARGFAHLGVMKALMEVGIEPDFIGGTSIGSIMGAMRALDLRGQGIIDFGRRLFLEGRGPTSDVNLLPLVSLVKGVKTRRLTERAVQELAGAEIDIEDTWLTFFCMAGNYSTSSEVTFDRGPLARSVLASYAIPGALPPVVVNGHLHVDGGTVNNLPVDVMERVGVGSIIAVDLLPEDSRPLGFDTIPGTALLLFDRLRSGQRRRYHLPSLPEMLLTAGFLQSNGRQKNMRERADLCFRPALDGVRPLQWRKYDEVVARGYASAKQHLETVPASQLAKFR